MMNTKIYLGTDIEKVATVSDGAFLNFLSKEVMPVINGCSVYEITGIWKGTFEKTKVVEFIHSDNELSAIKTIAKKYKTQFHQESVLIVSSKIETELLDFI